jgi:predicted enzyme related to lactoylglutathione lyase
MDSQLPDVPAGSGKHPILMVALAANRLRESAEFYRSVFGWHTHEVTPDIVVAPVAGATVSLRANTPEGFPGMVPFVAVPDVAAALQQAAAAGGAVERDPWTLPMAGVLARFKDPSGTIYGLTNATPAAPFPRIQPFQGGAPPADGSVCAIEMYAADGAAAGRFFERLFGWSARETMPQYVAFDPGAGVGGVFQSHTPSNPAVAYVYSSDVRAAIARVERAGGRRNGEPMAVPGMATFGYFTDPSGTLMGIIGG